MKHDFAQREHGIVTQILLGEAERLEIVERTVAVGNRRERLVRVEVAVAVVAIGIERQQDAAVSRGAFGDFDEAVAIGIVG